MRQGDVYWYTFREPDKRRPVVILTRSSAVKFLSGITVAPITTTIRNIPSEVVLSPEDGLPQVCAANLDNIQTVPKNRFGAYITHLSRTRMQAICEAISFALGFDAPGDPSDG